MQRLRGLPATTRRRIQGRRARFSRVALHNVHYPLLPALTEAQRRARPDVHHPLARRHPHSGRVALYLGRWACDVDGLPADEGRALIAELQEFAQQPRFIYRHQWRVGDAILWDNRCTQHRATGFDDEAHIRTMYRTTLEGELPIMAEAPVEAAV
ncbi:MAG: TauD/TfdA family dioxygenase [Proteobacteria bacterium]|nr:TauD/TfdA family dioxygenase [Pseudomonadota bacterium]